MLEREPQRHSGAERSQLEQTMKPLNVFARCAAAVGLAGMILTSSGCSLMADS